MRRIKSGGFSLIELITVIAIIAALAAIAIPQFSKYRNRAYNDVAISDLRNAETCQEAYFTDNHEYAQNESTLISNYNLYKSDGVPVINIILSANKTSYIMLATHGRGDVVYQVAGPGGAISSTPKPKP